MAYTLWVEQALQSIDPSIAMPYWDYGMDEYLYNSYVDSPVFQDDWFGAVNPANNLHRLTQGRFSDVSLPDGAPYREWDIAKSGMLNPFVNGYGDMRSPWNNNPTRYMGRRNSTYGGWMGFTGLPTCKEFRDGFASTSLSEVRSARPSHRKYVRE